MSNQEMNLTGGLKISAAGKTDTGRKRKANQDSIYLDPNSKFFILADGMGGHKGGEEASRLAIEAASMVFNEPDSEKWVETTDQPLANVVAESAARFTKAAILEANRSVTHSSETNAEYKGMGSTVNTLHIGGDIATIGHVGDSRVYRMSHGVLEQMTEDHSLLNEELKRRKMTEEEIANFPFKNRIVRALGHLTDGRIDIIQRRLEKGDAFLMCSDGLTDVANDIAIRNMLHEYLDDPKRACDVLVDYANEGGGPDNISVIVAVVVE